MDKLMEVVNEYKGNIVYIEYFKSPNAEQTTNIFGAISGMDATHVKVITAFESTLIMEALPISGLVFMGEDRYARRGETKVLYSNEELEKIATMGM